MGPYSLSLLCGLAATATVQFDVATSLGNPTIKYLTWTKSSFQLTDLPLLVGKVNPRPRWRGCNQSSAAH